MVEQTQEKQQQARRDPHYLQTRWISAAKGKQVEITLTCGVTMRGTLVASDQFTLAIKEDNGSLALVYKGSCAVLRREGGGGNDQ